MNLKNKSTIQKKNLHHEKSRQLFSELLSKFFLKHCFPLSWSTYIYESVDICTHVFLGRCVYTCVNIIHKNIGESFK